MKVLYDLKETYMRGLEELDTVKEGRFKMGELEAVQLMTDTIKNIDKICMLEEDGDYSRAGEWEAEMRGNYGRGSSYRRHRDSDGRYSRDGEMSYRRGYSRDGGKDKMMEHLEKAMDSATTEQERSDIRRMMDKLEKS